MSDQNSDLRGQIEAAAQQVTAMEAQLRAIQSDVQKLPFLARGFVERDISQSTGRNLTEWAAASQKLFQQLQGASAGPTTAQSPLAAYLGTELPKMAALRAYLQKAPEKVTMVPAAILKPQQRAEFLAEVQQQVNRLQDLEQRLGAIAQALQSA